MAEPSLDPQLDRHAAEYDRALNRGISVSGEGRDWFARERLLHLARCLERLAFRPQAGESLTARGNPAARDLGRHAFADVGGDATRARAWARAARRWPTGAQSDLLDAYGLIDVPTLLLWADEDRLHPLAIAEEALGLLPDAQLRVLPGTGFLMAYDDPVGMARELAAFCI